MMVFTKNKSTNALSIILRLFFSINGTSTHVMTMLANIGLSVSVRTVERLKERITEDAIELAIELVASGRLLGVIMDNINLYNTKFSQRITNRNTMIHATNTALIGVDEEGIDIEGARALAAKLKLRGNRKDAKYADITLTAEDDKHMAKAFTNLISELVVRYCPNSGKWKN